jgi:stage IV sporulation protein FB
MTLRKCSGFENSLHRLYGALVPGFTIGPLHFTDPMLLCGALFLLFRYDAGGWLRLSLLASVLHECGHILVYAVLLRRFPPIDVNLTGFCMHTARLMLPPGREFWIATAGPGINFLTAGALYWHLGYGGVAMLGFFWANLLIGAFNLLPIPPLDGYTLLALAGTQLQFRHK